MAHGAGAGGLGTATGRETMLGRTEALAPMAAPAGRLTTKPPRRGGWLLACLLALMLAVLAAGASVAGAQGEPAWTTYHRDAGRSGADPDTQNPVAPTLAWQSRALGAPIWGQPLVLGSRVYVATVGNAVVALDAASGAVVWEASAGVPVPSSEVICGDVDPTVGIVGTPVIDPTTKAIYAVADVWNAGTKTAHHVLEGFDLASGKRVLETAVDPPGADPKALLERPALNIDQGHIVFGFGGNAGDCGSYRGAVVSVPENGAAPSFWVYQPSAPAIGGAAVWGPSGPTVDGEGHVFVSTGNPNFPEGHEVTQYDLSDSLLELSSSMQLIGAFAPETWLSDSNSDRDLGSAGPELLPGGLLFQAGKNEYGYLIEIASMHTGAGAVYSQKVCKGKIEGKGEGSFGGDAYAAGTIYVPCNDGVRALSYDQSARSFAPLWQGPADAIGPPIVSGGLVWVLSGRFLHGGGTTLYALDPATGATRYTETLPSPVVDHFGSPTAAGGRVLVSTGSTVTAYRTAAVETAPTAVSEAATAVAQTTATLRATVNPNGSTVTECVFEYGPTATYGSHAPCTALPGAGTSPVAVSAAVAALQPNELYHFTIVATNGGGSDGGADQALSTLPDRPAVSTSGASQQTQSSMTLNGVVASEAATDECRFDYGTTLSYGSSVPCASTPVPGGGGTPVSAAVTGLSAGTSYFVRLVASNAGGIAYANAVSAETLPSDALQTPIAGAATLTPLTGGLPQTSGSQGGQSVLGSQEQLAPVSTASPVGGSSLRVKRGGTVAVGLRCTAGRGPCAGMIALRSAGSVAGAKGRRAVLKLAGASFTLKAGGHAVVKLRLSPVARRLLAHQRRLRALLLITTTAPGGALRVQTRVTLRA